MFSPRPCGCKGIRTCLICEKDLDSTVNSSVQSLSNKIILEYCCKCEKAWPGENVTAQHPNHSGQAYDYRGVLVIDEFVSKEEELELTRHCDQLTWSPSQSGRRKQNFGPKTNFKKKKISKTGFNGFPEFSKVYQDKLRSVSLLSDFQTIEQCAIEYTPETGASIDPHIDDCWVWGERVLSLSLLSSSYLTMTKYCRRDYSKYNLDLYYNSCDDEPNGQQTVDTVEYPVVKILMPARSLLILYGPARYEWEHRILRSDIKDRRICLAYREFTKDYLPGGKHYEKVGAEILTNALLFHPVECN